MQIRHSSLTSFRIETYSYTAINGDRYRWNITEALRLIERSPREPDWFAPQEQGVTIPHIRERAPELDAAYAMTTDVAKPLLFIPFEGRHLLVDGWHRLYRAVAEGVTDLMAYTLTEEEAAAVLMEYYPAR